MSCSFILIFCVFFSTWPPWLSPTSNLRKAFPGEASRSTLARCRKMVQWYKYRYFWWFTFAALSMWYLQDFYIFQSSKRGLSPSLILFCLLRHTFRTCEVLVGLYDIHRSWTKSAMQFCGASHGSSCLDFLVKLPSPPFLSCKLANRDARRNK